MNSLILDGADSLVAAWPLAIVAIAIASLLGRAFVQAGRTDRAKPATGSLETGTGLTCRPTGHHYVRDAGGWCCSHCGDAIRNGALAGV